MAAPSISMANQSSSASDGRLDATTGPVTFAPVTIGGRQTPKNNYIIGGLVILVLIGLVVIFRKK